jgi:glycosyltransferase involved in cell wall biosynthesis
VLLEAIACGKPVVASRAGGVPEVVSSESYGVLVDPGKPEGFTAAILSALDRTWDVDKLTSHARQHSWERVSQAQEQLFQQVASGPFESKGQLHRPKVAHTES